MLTDKSSRIRKPGNTRSNNETPAPSDPTGIEGGEGTQVLNILTGGSNEPGFTTRSMTGNSKRLLKQ